MCRLIRWVALCLAFALNIAHGQPASRVGVLGADEPRFAEIASGLARGFRELGYGANAVQFVESRVPRGDDAAANAAVRTLSSQRLAAVFVMGSALVRPMREAAPKVPIVFITPGDPVASGIVASLARPGRGITAITYEYPELSAKRLELLRELLPRARRIVAFYDPRDASPRQGAEAARAAARALGFTLLERQVSSREEIERGLEDLDGADALLGIPGGVTSAHSAIMIAAATSKKIPAVFHVRSTGTRDALLTYGASDIEVARQCARLLDRILKGADAGELPVERPHRLSLTISAKAAKAIGLAIPQGLLVRADELVE